MHLVVLGSGAGGGCPQWNCFCDNCKAARETGDSSYARTQSSIAVSDDGKNWVVINASPDIRQQINQTPVLWPEGMRRGTQIKAIILSDSQVDHSTGLLSLREGLPLDVYCTSVVYDELTHDFPLFKVLESWHGGIKWQSISSTDKHFIVPELPFLRFSTIPLLSNAPPYSAHRDAPVEGNNSGFLITDTRTNKKVVYAPGMLQSNEHLEAALSQSDCALLDGTLWLDDEMIQNGFSNKTGKAMGHMPVNGPDGSLALLAKFAIEQKFLIHINNTNPILCPTSWQRNEVINAGVQVSWDGMQIEV